MINQTPRRRTPPSERPCVRPYDRPTRAPKSTLPSPAPEDHRSVPIVAVGPAVRVGPAPPAGASRARKRRQSRDAARAVAVPSTIPPGVHAPTTPRDRRASTTQTVRELLHHAHRAPGGPGSRPGPSPGSRLGRALRAIGGALQLRSRPNRGHEVAARVGRGRRGRGRRLRSGFRGRGTRTRGFSKTLEVSRVADGVQQRRARLRRSRGRRRGRRGRG